MLQKMKKRPEIILSTMIAIMAVVITTKIITTVPETSVTDVRVEGFNKYSVIDKQYNVNQTVQNDTTKMLDVDAMVKEYNESIPDLTDEELQKYIKVEMPIISTQPAQDTYVANKSSSAQQQVISQYSYKSDCDTSSLVGQLQAWGIPYGSKASRLDTMTQYDEIIQAVVNKRQQSCKYPIPVNLVKAMILTESGGNAKESGAAKGLMQIEYVNTNAFIEYGKKTYGEKWTSSDMFDPFKNIDYAVWVLAGDLTYYKGNYLKAVQAYNYSHYSLDKLIRNYGDDWINNRSRMASLNGMSSYGNPKYLEHVFRYYK